jgi:hypothetical protein
MGSSPEKHKFIREGSGGTLLRVIAVLVQVDESRHSCPRRGVPLSRAESKTQLTSEENEE